MIAAWLAEQRYFTYNINMIALNREADTPSFVPDYLAKSLSDVDFALLKKQGVRFIAFDADSTLVHIRGTALPEETKSLLIEKRKLFKQWCIASNRPINNLQTLGNSIGAPVIRAGLLTRKPSRRYFKKVLRHFNAQPHEVAMVGDKLIADMWGAKRAGMVTVWVEKIGPDNPWDRLLAVRHWERRLMQKYLSQGGD